MEYIKLVKSLEDIFYSYKIEDLLYYYKECNNNNITNVVMESNTIKYDSILIKIKSKENILIVNPTENYIHLLQKTANQNNLEPMFKMFNIQTTEEKKDLITKLSKPFYKMFIDLGKYTVFALLGNIGTDIIIYCFNLEGVWIRLPVIGYEQTLPNFTYETWKNIFSAGTMFILCKTSWTVGTIVVESGLNFTGSVIKFFWYISYSYK